MFWENYYCFLLISILEALYLLIFPPRSLPRDWIIIGVNKKFRFRKQNPENFRSVWKLLSLALKDIFWSRKKMKNCRIQVSRSIFDYYYFIKCCQWWHLYHFQSQMSKTFSSFDAEFKLGKVNPIGSMVVTLLKVIRLFVLALGLITLAGGILTKPTLSNPSWSWQYWHAAANIGACLPSESSQLRPSVTNLL